MLSPLKRTGEKRREGIEAKRREEKRMISPLKRTGEKRRKGSRLSNTPKRREEKRRISPLDRDERRVTASHAAARLSRGGSFDSVDSVDAFVVPATATSHEPDRALHAVLPAAHPPRRRRLLLDHGRLDPPRLHARRAAARGERGAPGKAARCCVFAPVRWVAARSHTARTA